MIVAAPHPAFLHFVYLLWNYCCPKANKDDKVGPLFLNRRTMFDDETPVATTETDAPATTTEETTPSETPAAE